MHLMVQVYLPTPESDPNAQNQNHQSCYHMHVFFALFKKHERSAHITDKNGEQHGQDRCCPKEQRNNKYAIHIVLGSRVNK